MLAPAKDISDRQTGGEFDVIQSKYSFRKKRLSLLMLVALVVISALANRIAGQDIRIEREVRETGIIRQIQPGMVSVITTDGRTLDCVIQNKQDEAIAIAGIPFRMPATISVNGSLSSTLVEKGMIVQFIGRSNEFGKTDGQIDVLQVLANSTSKLQIDFLERPEPGKPARVNVVGRVINLTKNKLQLQVPKSKWAKQERIVFEVAENSTLLIRTNDLNLVRPGDEVVNMLIYELSSGEKIVKEIGVRLTARRETVTTSYHDKLEQKFSHLSDESGQPREVVSANYVLYTDLSDRNSQILLAKLETMHALIGGYFGKRPQIPIECYVISDLQKWQGSSLHPEGVVKILEPAGVTITTKQPGVNSAKAVVYSCDKHGVCQHEAVHAFCAQAFGSTGPVWYSEGMAEMGQYWKPGELAVNIDPVVIDYLTNSAKKKMQDIVAAGQITGDTWQAYAWRWALCHLLANNPNYSRRFKRLGLDMMSGGQDSFENAFGNVADKISFEYDQFVQNFGNGYRVDLCSWDWNTPASDLVSTERIKSTIRAAGGWQPTKLLARKGISYDFVAEGEWRISELGNSTTADGDSAGQGKLIGILLHDFQIEGPFDLGAKGSFVAPVEGQLFLRCADRWTELADNEGEITVHLRRTRIAGDEIAK